jgi:hypothetical protein
MNPEFSAGIHIKQVELNTMETLILVAIGAFSLSGAIFNWNWFMNSRRARFVSMILTRTGARIFYGLLGITLIIIGLATSFAG